MSKQKIGSSTIEILDHSDKVGIALWMAKKRALASIGAAAEANAKKEITKKVYDTPPSPSYHRTGNLRNSISHAEDDDSAYIGTNIKYAPFVELGTSRMNPRPFLRPAASDGQYIAQYKALLKESMENA